MNLNDFLANTLPITIIELLAALAGSYFILKTKPKTRDRYLVLYLWITFIVEVIGAYAPIAYFTEYKYFAFVEDTPFRRNHWLYNLYTLYSYLFLSCYFILQLRNKKWKLILNVILVLFGISALLNLIFSGVYFDGEAQFTLLIGTLILVISIILFYFELLQSDLILQLKKFLPMYISVGILVFSLCVTPVDIFSKYFNVENTVYVDLRNNVFLYTNIFMYSMFTIGFIICSRKT